MEEDIEILPESEHSHTGGSMRSSEPIFGIQFRVDDMANPGQFLPQYNTHQNYQPSWVQGCNSCCGWFCMCLAYPFALCCCKCSCIYELPTSTAGIVEEFGKFSRLINPGFNMINPCTEEVKEVDMRIRILSPGVNQCITKDNVKLTVSSSIAYRVTNPILAYYLLGNQLNHALIESTQSSIRNIIGQNVLDQILAHRDRIADQFKKLVLMAVPRGVTVENVFIEDIGIPRETILALSAAAKQKRLSEASIITSKADVESAGLLKEAAQLLDTKAAMQIRYLEMVTQVAKRGAKLMMPIGVNKTAGNSY